MYPRAWGLRNWIVVPVSFAGGPYRFSVWIFIFRPACIPLGVSERERERERERQREKELLWLVYRFHDRWPILKPNSRWQRMVAWADEMWWATLSTLRIPISVKYRVVDPFFCFLEKVIHLTRWKWRERERKREKGKTYFNRRENCASPASQARVDCLAMRNER